MYTYDFRSLAGSGGYRSVTYTLGGLDKVEGVFLHMVFKIRRYGW